VRRAEEAVSCASAPRQPLAPLVGLRVLGELAVAARQTGQAATYLTHALALADACAVPFERASVVLTLAELRALQGEGAEAEKLRQEVHGVSRRLGAAPLLARARALEARQNTARPAGLSVRELEVLRLVAEAMTDAQVAERLSLSPRTVGQHLRSIYNKLGVNSRAAATRFAFEHGVRSST